jgi:Tc5 transposase DNA-binding domain
MQRNFPHTSPSLNTHKMVNEQDMQKALAEIESSLKPNYTVIARKHGLTPSTVIRRVQGKTVSREEFQSQVHQCLTNAQERVLINQINRLTERGIPPTSQMVRNFAEEMIGRAIGKNWVGEFCRRHQSELKSLYLRNIENLRVKGEYGPTYKLFYDLVECFFALLYCSSRELITDVCLVLVTPCHRKQ